MKIFLDYGHGGRDPGAVFGNLREKDENLLLGKMVKKKLEREGVHVVETRSGDQNVSLRERVKLANEGNYDYILSLHRNAFMPYTAKGIEGHIYTKFQKSTKDLIARILEGLSQLGFINRGVKYSNFYILKHTKAKALLLEIGFIDNPDDNLIFQRDMEKIATIIVREIIRSS